MVGTIVVGVVVLSKYMPRKQVRKQMNIEGKLLCHRDHYLIAG